MRPLFAACAGLALALAACDQKPSPSPEGETTTQAAAPAQAEQPANTMDKAGAEPAAQQAQPENSNIPTEADFEEEAEQSITAKNLEQEVTALEKEVASDREPSASAAK